MINQYDWNTSTKIGFRFSFIFILTFIIIFNNGAFSLLQYIAQPILIVLKSFSHWFSIHILNYQYDASITINGSGDTSYAWVTLIIIFLFAFLGAIIWSILDCKRKNYNSMYYWLTVIIRYYVGFMLINYGVIKLVHGQMPPPSLRRLMEPVGEMSPMGLAWTYLGYSKSYNIVVGIVEILAGLLLFRRTLVIGSLITIATSINIMLVNYFYDVPVKMISTALFLFSLYLLLPYIKKISSFLLYGKSEPLEILKRPNFKKSWMNKALNGIKFIGLALFLAAQITNLVNRPKLIAQYFPKSTLEGIFRIESHTDSRSIPNHWSYIIFYMDGYAQVRDNYYIPHDMEVYLDTAKTAISINNYTFNYSIKQNGDIVLQRDSDGNTEKISLTKINSEDFELMKRKFNLIQEYPNNR